MRHANRYKDEPPEGLAGLVAEKLAAGAAPRMQQIVFQGERYWVKRAGHRGWFLRMSKGPAERLLAGERAALRKMEARGIPVPQLVLEGPGYLVTRHVGRTAERLLQVMPARQPELASQIAAAIARLHRCGAAHGGAHLRNICLADGQVSFIDLEKAQAENAVLTAQAYDLRVLIFSAFAAFPERPELARALLQSYGESRPPAGVIAAARAWSRRHRWLAGATWPLRWHERRYRPERRYRQYGAVPPALRLLGEPPPP